MKKNVTYIANEKFMSLVESRGLQTKENAGFIQVRLGNDYHLYVAKTKSVGRVDLQWAPELEGVRALGAGEKFGRILAQLDFGRTEAEILATFEAVLDDGVKLPKYEKPKKVQPGTVVASSLPEVPAAPDKTKEDRLKDLEEAKRLRAEKIRQVAAEMGMAISPNANIE